MTSKFLTSQDILVDDDALSARFVGIDVTSGETEPLVNALTAYLAQDKQLPDEKVQATVKDAKALLVTLLPTLGIEAKVETASNDSESIPDNGTIPIKITDVHAWKASLSVSAGARAVKPLVEFEDTEPKL